MINIQDIIPFMKKGWIAMDKDGRWFWYKRKPIKYDGEWVGDDVCTIWFGFDIAPADDWTKSLIKVGGK